VESKACSYGWKDRGKWKTGAGWLTAGRRAPIIGLSYILGDLELSHSLIVAFE